MGIFLLWATWAHEYTAIFFNIDDIKIMFIQCEVKMTGLIVAVVLVCDFQSATWEIVRSTRNGSWSNDARRESFPLCWNSEPR